jgi:hypothetical protein
MHLCCQSLVLALLGGCCLLADVPLLLLLLLLLLPLPRSPLRACDCSIHEGLVMCRAVATQRGVWISPAESTRADATMNCGPSR